MPCSPNRCQETAGTRCYITKAHFQGTIYGELSRTPYPPHGGRASRYRAFDPRSTPSAPRTPRSGARTSPKGSRAAIERDKERIVRSGRAASINPDVETSRRRHIDRVIGPRVGILGGVRRCACAGAARFRQGLDGIPRSRAGAVGRVEGQPALAVASHPEVGILRFHHDLITAHLPGDRRIAPRAFGRPQADRHGQSRWYSRRAGR